MECQSVWKWNNVRKRAAEVGEETSETLSEQAGSTGEAAAEGCATSCSERSWWEEDRGGETLEGIGKRSGMGRCQTERARESEWGGGRGGGGDCVVLTSEIVRGEASEWALRSRQRGTRETRSKVTPVIDTLASGKVLDVFFFSLWMIQQYFVVFCGAWRANEISQPVTSKLCLYVGWKSDVKRCNKSLKVVCWSSTPSGRIVLSNLFCPVAQRFPPPGRFSVCLSRGG